MDNSRAERMEDKLDKITGDITDIKVTMAVNTNSLVEHIRRTNALEKKVTPLWTTYKVVAAVISLTFVVAAVIEVINYFKK